VYETDTLGSGVDLWAWSYNPSLVPVSGRSALQPAAACSMIDHQLLEKRWLSALRLC
jgi:hypothetical protein